LRSSWASNWCTAAIWWPWKQLRRVVSSAVCGTAYDCSSSTCSTEVAWTPCGASGKLARACLQSARHAPICCLPDSPLPTGHKPAEVMNDTDVQAPKIEFPCERYPIKVIGEVGEGFTELIIEVMQRHAPDFDAGSLVIRDSRNG